MRLSEATLDRLPPGIARFSYERAAQAVGIVHFGIGAFHRAHQAWYTDLAMSGGERDWMVAGVSLRSSTVAKQLNPQDGLYTLTERSGSSARTRVVGAIRQVLVGQPDRPAIVDRIVAPECHFVSFTVTEKGYARAADGALEFELAEASFYPLLLEGLARRRDSGLSGLTLLSCDNLADNGRQLERLMTEYIEAKMPDLSAWFAAECACPGTMVDRIVPATIEADLRAAANGLGVRDEGAVFAERFSQWVIEDKFAGPRPGWEKHGAQLVRDVAPYETAKLRMLNGAHSALAYCGLERGHEFVHQAIADPALNHRLMQIAMDGSQKIPQRWLETLACHQRRGSHCPAILEAVAAWLRHVRGDRREVDDPMAEELAELWAVAGANGIAAALFGPQGLFARSWEADEAALAELTERLV